VYRTEGSLYENQMGSLPLSSKVFVSVENGSIKDGFYFELVDYSDVIHDSAGLYIVVCRLWEITDSMPEVKDPHILDEATRRVQAFGMEPSVIGLPGRQGRLDNPATSLPWFFNNGFDVFEIDYGMMQS